jgi:hypothetical protein
MRLPRSFGALHEPSFARYLAAVIVSSLGTGMANIALAFAVLEFGGATDLGIVLLAREVPMVVFLLLGGVFADRPCSCPRCGASARRGRSRWPGPNSRRSRDALSGMLLS